MTGVNALSAYLLDTAAGAATVAEDKANIDKVDTKPFKTKKNILAIRYHTISISKAMRLPIFFLALCIKSACFAPAFANMPDSASGGFKTEALCTISNAYATCHPQIRGEKLIINFPSELVVLNKEEIKSVDLYDSRRRELIRFFKKTGDIDFAISFLEGNETRTGFIRFKNNRSARTFYKKLEKFNPKLISSSLNIEVY